MHGFDVVEMVYDVLGLDDRISNDRYSHGKILRALNGAVVFILPRIRESRAGLFESRASLTVEKDSVSVSLPSDCHSVLRVVDGDEEALAFGAAPNKFPRKGIRLLRSTLEWDEAMGEQEAWSLDYFRFPMRYRYGTIPTSGGGASPKLPVSDSEGAVSLTDDAYNTLSFSILSGTGRGERAFVSDYTGSSRQLAVSPVFAVNPADADTYVLGEDWPDEWAEVLARLAAERLIDAGHPLQGPPIELLLNEVVLSSRGQSPSPRKNNRGRRVL